MNIIISWKEHDRTYTIGVKKFLKALDVEKSDADIKNAAKRILNGE